MQAFRPAPALRRIERIDRVPGLGRPWRAVLSALVLATSLAACGGGAVHRDEGTACSTTDAAHDLAGCVRIEQVLGHVTALVDIATANGGSRLAGSAGDRASAEHVATLLREAGYRVTFQDVTFETYAVQHTALEQQAPTRMVLAHEDLTFAGNGDVTAAVAPASAFGCDAADYAGVPRGSIALVRRGACTFIAKATLAADAGAAAMVVQNVDDDLTDGNLGEAFKRALPAVAVTRSVGEQLRAQLAEGVVLRVQVAGSRTRVNTRNVLAETPGGDPTRTIMAGAHLDTVAGTVGANDNATGVAALLETALQLARVPTRHKVRFAFWSGEEWELNGSTAYVANLSAGERKRIAAYLNFDMIASPNHVYGLFGGNGDAADGSALPGDAGARIRRLFTTAYEDAGVPWMLVPDERRSDHAAFAAAGIPFGGLFTGGEELKTDEEARRWGGTAGAPYDPCYHQRCDGLSNLNVDALEVNARVVASAVHALAMAEGGW